MSLLDNAATNWFGQPYYGSTAVPISGTSSPTVSQPATTSDWSSWFKNIAGLTTAAAPIVASALGNAPQPKPSTANKPAGSMLTIILIGAGVLIVGGIAFLLARR